MEFLGDLSVLKKKQVTLVVPDNNREDVEESRYKHFVIRK